MLSILHHPDPVLREVCTSVAVFDDALSELADQMLETMYAAPGRGLAAPQIGQAIRLFVMDVTWREGAAAPQVFVNPVLTWTSDSLVVGTEGCLSIPDTPCDVRRPAQVEVAWKTLDGSARSARFDGFAARCIQHERDHLDGILCIDHVDAAV